MRKVLSFVLVLSLVLGSFSMAFAATPASTGLSDIDGIDNEAAIQVSYDLGIVTGNPDGTFLPTKAVTRAEFAAMITRALAIPDSALAGYTSTSFKDTTGYGWAVPYLAFCQSKGILLGDGAGNVMPGRTINTNEAVTMVLRAIGYTSNSSVLVGLWPANYVSLAQDLDLYSDVASVANVDKANAAQILYNALTLTKVQVATDGTTTNLATSMLTSGLDCTSTNRIVNDGDSSIINIAPYVGAYATVYTNDDGDVVAVKEKSTFLTGKWNAAKTKFTANDVDYTMATTQTVTTVAGLVNNAVVTASAGAVTNFAASTTFTIAADLSGKTINGVYTVNQWKVTAAEKADSAIQQEIADNKLLNFDFAENDDEDIDVNSFALVGVASLDKIAKDNVVYVYTLGNGASADIVKVAVGTETVEGIVQAFNVSDDEAKVNGKYYANSGQGTDLGTGNVSDTVKVWLDASGDVYDFDVTEGNADNYAVVTGTKSALGYDNIIKLLDKEGAEKTYTLDSDLTVNPAKGQIVVFGLDSDGIVDSMDVTTAAVVNGQTISANVKVETSNVLTFGGKSYRISSDVVVFTYEGAAPATATDFDMSAIADVDDTTIVSTSAIYFDEDGVVAAILVPADSADSSANDIYGVVNGKELTVNADNDKVYQLTGFANGAALDKLTSSEAKAAPVLLDTKIRVYKFGVDADGAINEVILQNIIGQSGTGALTSGSALASGSGIVVTNSGTGYISGNATIGAIALADDVKYYQVTFNDDGTVDEYSVFSGTVREGYKVWMVDTDTTDAPGYEVVVVLK